MSNNRICQGPGAGISGLNVSWPVILLINSDTWHRGKLLYNPCQPRNHTISKQVTATNRNLPLDVILPSTASTAACTVVHRTSSSASAARCDCGSSSVRHGV